MPNYSKQPFLTATDEEYTMLIEVCEEFEKQKIDKTAREKSGNPTEIIIRNHLLRRNLNLSKVPEVTLQGSKIKNDLLLLKNKVDPNQENFPVDSVKMVIEVRNSGVGGKTLENGKREDPNKILRFKFNELEGTTNMKNFAVIVLSETLLPPRTPNKWRFKEEVIGKKNCKVFTLVARQLYPPGGLYVKSNIVEMLQNKQMKKPENFNS
ncbi:MAG TPA: hypothetical protein VMD05_02210 [Candidatus Nanoarchaeia archaeon]|nr:hypothetical protein [Candidatus Nanoarchaeia archaeon]